MHKTDRSNKNLELTVRYGLILDAELGAVNAWTFMASNGVQESVILRVLLNSEKRREADTLAVSFSDKHRKMCETIEAMKSVFIGQHFNAMS